MDFYILPYFASSERTFLLSAKVQNLIHFHEFPNTFFYYVIFFYYFLPLLKNSTFWCTEADFRKGTSWRKAHDDHNVINDPIITVGISFYVLVPDVKTVIVSFHFYHFRLFLFFLPSNQLICHSHAGQWLISPFSGNAQPEEHLQPQAMHAWQWRLQDFRHGDRKAQLSPFIVAPPFVSSRGALRHYIRSLFLFASPCMPPFPCRLQDGISVSFSLLGQR